MMAGMCRSERNSGVRKTVAVNTVEGVSDGRNGVNTALRGSVLAIYDSCRHVSGDDERSCGATT